jgi:hypothetical protein
MVFVRGISREIAIDDLDSRVQRAFRHSTISEVSVRLTDLAPRILESMCNNFISAASGGATWLTSMHETRGQTSRWGQVVNVPWLHCT